jgi:hypothetical protein
MGDDGDRAGPARAAELAGPAAGTEDIPHAVWQLMDDVQAGVSITITYGGTLWVHYGWNRAPAKAIYVFHQGGGTTPIRGGQNQVPVQPGDSLIYRLERPTDMIKLVYALV